MQFVILDHKPASAASPSARTCERHFDLLLEVRAGEKLRTIAMQELPLEMNGKVEIESLPDHRTEYLTYEGPLTENRGSVSRFAQGSWEGDITTKAKLSFGHDSANFAGESWELRLATEQGVLLRIG